MSDPLQALGFPGGAGSGRFAPNSRYHGLEIAMLETATEKVIPYLRRRFVPAPERLALLVEHTVVEHERLDNIAARYLGDPEQFWQICDANNALHPPELTENPGRRLRITLPEGVVGVTGA
jgi:hypothetical protein